MVVLLSVSTCFSRIRKIAAEFGAAFRRSNVEVWICCRLSVSLANRSAAETDNLQQIQTSTFDLLKAAPNSAAIFRILEKQVLTDNKTTITRYLVWTWDPELERFRSSLIDGAD